MERIHMNHLRDLLHRLRAGESDHRIARDMQISRPTVRKYHGLAKQEGYLEADAEIPDDETLQRVLGPGVQAPRQASTVEPYREKIQDWVNQGVEMTAIWQRLKENYGFKGGYSSIRRFVHRLKPVEPEKRSSVFTANLAWTCKLISGRWVSCTIRSPSACGQLMCLWRRSVTAATNMPNWIALHKRTFEYFGGVPQRVIPDNLKAAVLKALVHDPILGEAYRRMALHYTCTHRRCGVVF